MPKFEIFLSDEQLAAVQQAAAIARCTPAQLAEQGLRMAAAAWGVQLPRRVSRVRPAPRTAPSPGGRPRASYAVERDEPGGAFLRSCPNCGREFRTDNPRMMYCSTGCKKSVQYRRHYTKRRGGA